MWDLLEVSRRRLAFATGWGVLALGSGLGLAALAAWLIARAWQMPPVLDLTVAVVAVRALGISRGVCRYLERLATHDVALRSMTAARTSVYRALARAPLWLTRRADIPGIAAGGPTAPTAPGGPGVPGRLRRGDVLVRVGTDIDDLGAVVVRTFVPIAVALVLALAAVGLLACISLPAAGVLTAALAFAGIVAPWLSARAAAAAERSARADRAEFAAHALTVLDHAAELRVAGKLDSALDTAAAANRRALAAEDRAAGRNAWAAAAIPLATGVTVLAALLIGIIVYGPGGGAAPGAMTPMALAVLVLLPLSAFEATGPLPAAAQTLTVARAALHRLRTVSPDHRPEPLERDDETAADATGRVPRATGSRKRFGTGGYPHPFPYADSRADGVVIGWVGDGQWQIPERPQASRVVVVGPSGAGKTTLLMAWAGLFDDPDDQVRFFAEDAHLFGTSVLENLRVARGDLDAATAERALRTVGLGDWLDGLPDGVHTDLPGGAAAVSGGQRRRLLLARALVSPARALLLDEPTEHLDAVAGAQLLRDLLDIDSGLVAADRDVVVVTHQLPAGHRAGLVITVDESGQVRAAFADGKATRYALDEIPLPTTAGGG
jgi:ATP-binding cassette subfamily C protein CydC